mgnify:CR=1 FL=1
MSIELFKEGIRKCWILPLILTILLIVVIPLYMMLGKGTLDESAKSFQQIDQTASSMENPVELNLEGTYKSIAGANVLYSAYAMLTILILPVVLGTQLFGNSKKGKNRLSDFIKEKGITKESVYKTNMVTGIVLTISPILITTIILLIIKLFAGMGDYITGKMLANWAFLGIFSSALFLVVTAVMGITTKNKVMQVLYTYGVLFIPVFIIYLFEMFMTKVIYGFPGFSTGVIEFLNQIPSIKVCQMFTSEYVNYVVAHSLSLWYLLADIIIALVLALVGYKLLKVENQEKVQKLGDVFFKYVWIFLIGMLVYIAMMLNYNNSLISISITVAAFLLVYILKEIITKKSIKALANGKRYYIISATVVVVTALMSSDLLGYEDKIPELADVEYMTYTLAYPNESGEVTFTEDENIKTLIDRHKNFILEKNSIKNMTSDKYTKIYIKYKLFNGKSIIRSYETVLSVDDPLFQTDEYIKQKYAYMYDNQENVDILKIAGVYNGKTFIFEANRYENLDILNEVLTYTGNDILNYKVHIPETNAYQQYSEKEGIQLMQIGILDGMNQYTSYLYYLKVEPEYELVQKMQSLIDENSEFITWYENE